MYSGGARAARKICTKTVENWCQNCRCIRRMAVRTLNGSAIQARRRSASSTGVPGKGMASRRPFSRSTALLSPHLEVFASHRFLGRQAWNLFRHASLLRLQQEMQHMRRDLPSLQQKLARERSSNLDFQHPEQLKVQTTTHEMASPVQRAVYDS